MGIMKKETEATEIKLYFKKFLQHLLEVGIVIPTLYIKNLGYRESRTLT